MQDRLIKNSAIIFGGYLYQNLIGLEVLCKWLDDPNFYEWVKFEADDDEIPRGLDDIVALRKDGLYELLQVKFTVDPNNGNNCLSWEWLLQHKLKGRSLLQKWHNALFNIGINNVAEVALISNRHPNRDFLACLNETTHHVNLTLVPSEINSQITAQLGSAEAAAQFFRSFEFRHSHQGYLSLQRTLLDRYVPRYTTYHGWNFLYLESINWAVRKDFPFPDGRIKLGLLKGILDQRRPEPISQSFRIPEGYCPPDEEFSDNFIKSLTEHDRKVVILWGSPGQGKSTFLSYVCSCLDKLAVPYIRHHYFLELSDTSERFSLPAVANSLMGQMEILHIEHVHGQNNNVENLRKWIEVCASGYATEGKRFILIVDGLDHVWRENEHNKQPLESLFRNIFPVPDNVTLVVGTQKVSDEQLPSLFSKFINAEDWVELPRMSLSAIKGWLEVQLKANRFEIPDQSVPLRQDPITELAVAFHQISGGHPLHLTYSFEALAHEDHVLTPVSVSKLPNCPEGDIKKYYRMLWETLSLQAKDALHLVADAGFIWPPLGLEDCLSIRVGELNREIGHLFYITEAGNVPFHGSILAFIQDDGAHKKRICELLPNVVDWLQTKAPVFYRWGWLWLFKARIGQSDELINYPNRSWIIESLTKAYPKDHIIKILTEAERLAFKSLLFPRAVRLRLLKIRLINGPTFQLDEYNRLYECALKLSDDDYPLRNLSANFHAATIDELHLLGKQYLAIGRKNDATECQEQMRQRINDRIRVTAYDSNMLETMSKQYLEITAATGDYKADRLLQSIQGFESIAGRLFVYFIQELSKHHNVRLLVELLIYPMFDGMRHDLELAIIRLAGACQAHLHDWSEFNNLRNHPIVECWGRLYTSNKSTDIPFVSNADTLDSLSPTETSQDFTGKYLHDLFFYVLAKCLELAGATPIIAIDKFNKHKWLNTAVQHVVTLASNVGNLLARGENTGFAHCYRLSRNVQPPKGYEDHRDYVAFRQTLLSISIDLFLLTAIRNELSEIPQHEWLSAIESEHFLFSDWSEQYMAHGFRILPGDAILEELNKRLTAESNSISPFNDRVYHYLESCELAICQKLNSLGETILAKAFGCVMGYGWHKDVTIFNVLDAIKAIAMDDPDFAKDTLARICPIIDSIAEITDGDDVTYAKYEMAEQLIQLFPHSYTAYYEYLLKSSEWYAAEEVFSRFLQKAPLDSPLLSLVTKGIWTATSVSAFKSRGFNDISCIETIINDNARYYGILPDDFGKKRDDYTTPINEDHGIAVKDYPPANLDAMLKDLKERHVYTAERKAMKEWFDYWKMEGHGAELLKVLEPYIDEENIPSGIVEILDDVFALSLSLEGKQKAFRWIVAAHIHRHGWTYYYSMDDALKRFASFSSNYANRWEEFLIKTSRSAYRDSKDELVIPTNRLVHFLVIIGQIQLAKDVTEQLVQTVIEEVSDQPLETPAWFHGS